jgi:hypothetical protein
MKLHFVSYTHFVVLSGRMIANDELENLWEELAGSWTRAHNDELHKLRSSPNIIKAIKSNSMRWVSMQHVWRRWEIYI